MAYYPLILIALLLQACSLAEVNVHTSQRAVNQGEDDTAKLERGNDISEDTTSLKGEANGI